MFPKKSESPPVPVIVSIFRVVHGLLVMHALAIVGITFFMSVSGALGLTNERIFAMAVAIPIGLGSLVFLLVTIGANLFVRMIFPYFRGFH